MKVSVDRASCASSGNCVMAAPEVFDQSEEDGTVVLLEAEPGNDLHADVRNAADGCPARAIAVSEEP